MYFQYQFKFLYTIVAMLLIWDARSNTFCQVCKPSSWRMICPLKTDSNPSACLFCKYISWHETHSWHLAATPLLSHILSLSHLCTWLTVCFVCMCEHDCMHAREKSSRWMFVWRDVLGLQATPCHTLIPLVTTDSNHETCTLYCTTLEVGTHTRWYTKRMWGMDNNGNCFAKHTLKCYKWNSLKLKF